MSTQRLCGPGQGPGRRRFPVPLLGRVLGLALVLLTGCGDRDPGPGTASEDDPSLPPAAVLALNNRGVGQMGYFDYGAARNTFAAVVEQAPAWLDGRINLAIATLNRQGPGDEAAALALVEDVLAAAPAQLRAHFVAGILRFNQGAIEAARGHFETVFRADPNDAYAAYFFGQCELQLGAAEAALSALEQAIEQDPYLRSAWYGAFLAEQQLGRRELARERLTTYQRLERNPRSRLAEIKYTRMGPRAEALAVRTEATPPSGSAGVTAWRATRAPFALAGIDRTAPLAGAPLVDASHRWLALPGPDGLTILDEGGDVLTLPFSGDPAVVAVGWGDFDSDGRTDAYLARDGADALWLQRAEGWENVAAAAGTALAGRTTDVLVLDADHDGDLDLFATREDAPDELLNNNGDGTFRPLAADRGMSGTGVGGRVSATDIDGDRDLDLLVARPGQGLTVFLNDRLWDYRPLAGPADFSGGAFVTADFDASGQAQLCALATDALRCWTLEGERWVSRGTVPLPAQARGRDRELALADMDGDGDWEFLVAGDDGFAILERDGELRHAAEGALLAIWNRDPTTGPQLLVRREPGTLETVEPAGGLFTALAFAGREDSGDSMRSNVSGIGTRYVLRNGSRWTVGWLLPTASGPGSALQPALIGQPRSDAEYVEVDWTDGVFQTELTLSPGRVHRIVETQRQLASCPVLFAWDGQRHRFLSDVLGVGGIGFATGPGEYAEPRPREAFRIPGELLKRRAGAFELRLTEPMEETAYVDRVSLEAIDRPANLTMVLDERLATNGVEPSGEPLFFDRLLRPVRATDRHGDDQRDALLHADGVAAPPGARHPRFLGLLGTEQVLTLEFDQPLDRLRSPVLLLDGWVEYGYSQTSFAAWQAGLSYEAPTLEARSGAGPWQTVASRFGYPAGMPREAALPLPPLPAATTALRLRSNQEIYFDRLAIAETTTVPETRTQVIPLATARVERVGFPRRSDGPQRQPSYDYEDRVPFWDTRYQRGFYTGLGEATELLVDRDNGLAIIGPGDALVLRFSGDLPPLPPGWKRDFVVRFDGWAKDMDLYTRSGETVAPLPRAAVSTDRSELLHARFNTRFQSGR